MKKIQIIYVVMLMIGLSVNAQNPIHKSFFWKNISSYNPAFYGFNDNFSAQFQTSLTFGDNIPSYSLVNVDGRIMQSVGLGATVDSESFGSLRNTYMYGGASYGFYANDDLAISLGLSLGYMNSSYSNVEFEVNPNVDLTDPFLTSGGISTGRFIMGTGIAISTNRILAGLSLPVLLKDGGKFNPLTTLYFNSSFALNNRMSLTPMALANLNVQNQTYSADVAAQFKWNNVESVSGIALVVGGNTKEQIYIAPSFLFGYFEVGYSFKASLGDFKQVNPYMHEVSLSFSTGKSTFKQVDMRDRFGFKKGKARK